MKRVISFFSFAIIGLFCGLYTPLFGQLFEGGEPCLSSFSLRSLSEKNRVVLDKPSEKAIQDFVYSCTHRGALRVMPLGLPIETSLTPQNSGVLSRNERGALVWDLSLVAPGAITTQLYFDQFVLPKGGRLFILSPDGKVLKGAYTERNNTELKALAISPVKGDELIIHYEGRSGDEELPLLSLKQVTYGFWDTQSFRYQHPAFGRYNPGEPWFSGDWSCAPNVVAFPEMAKQAHSLVQMMVRGSVVCSGALINNGRQDGTAYILTASHCMNASFRYSGDMNYVKESARQTVFFFNFRSPLAETMVRGIEEQSLSGAEVVAYDEDHDLCLLKITGIDKNPEYKKSGGIPASFMPYYSGWNAELTPKGFFTNLHHPTASVARYNRCDEEELPYINFSASGKSWKGTHFAILKWSIGTTYGGSSGSPLYDKEGLIIGALTGGQSTCEAPQNDAFYAISKCFALTENKKRRECLSPWLAPDEKVLKLKGFDPYAPKSPKRLSYNYYSLNREKATFPTIKNFEQAKGIVNAYPIPAESKLLGLFVVANYEWVGRKSLPNIVIWAKNEVGEERAVFKGQMQLPKYEYFNGYSSSANYRTLIGWLDSYISLESLNLMLKENETLYIGFEMETDDALPFAIMRGESDNCQSYIKLKKNSSWLKANIKDIPTELRGSGNFWIDPIVLPIKESSSITSPNAICGPSAVIYGGKMRVVMPENCISDCQVVLYSLKGEKLYTTSTNSEVAEFVLPQGVIDEKLIVVYFTFGDKQHYGVVLHSDL